MLITTGFEVICTLRGLEDFGAGFEGAHEARDGPFGDFAQEGFELGEGFFDGVHIRTVGWEISQLRARRLDELLDPRPLVSREIVHDDDLAGRERGDEACLQPILEPGGVDRPVESLCRCQAAKAKAGDQSHRFVVTVRDGRPQAAPAPATSAFAREIGGGSGLVNENEFRRIEIELPREPFPASILDVCALLLLGMRRFF